MAWYTHAPTFADPETGAFSEDFQGIVSNFPAMANGDPGSPPIMLAALPRLVAGNAVRAVVSGVGTSTVGFGTFTGSVSVGMMQFGTFRVILTNSGTGISKQNQITRTRAGVDTIIHGPTATNPATFDVDCIPGDLFEFQCVATSGAIGQTANVSASIRTNNVDLYPGQGLWGFIQGNSAAP